MLLMLIYDAKLQHFMSFVKHFEVVYNKIAGFRYKTPVSYCFLNIALQ